ncbi:MULTISPECIES: MFS transporter [Mesorhizobium]|uniref:MFS transporter n=1 Tax=Mesorhizobium denitrificans TaxID=2294114 RepID=A0A371XES8_9HYPH|nr:MULTISPECIES: MFS transporter [Mesorhizobium]RFC67722.1 MFS transporter [Mesorhizobium denitrificans]
MNEHIQQRPSSLAPLSHSTFRAVWLASLASNFGGLIQSVGSAWLMTAITTSDDMVALVQASTTLPIMLFSLASGAIADNFDRRRVILIAQGFMLVVSTALAAFAWFGLITPWLLLAFTFLIGCGTALNNPSWQASVGDMVPRDHLPAAVALNSVGFNLTRSVGPAIGGAIVAAFGAAAAFIVNAFSYIALLIVIARWQPNIAKSSLPRETMGRAMTAGLRYVGMSPHIEIVLFRALLFGFTAIVILALLPLVARDLLGGGALTYGILLGCFGIGAVCGAFIGGRARQRISNEWIVRLSFAGFALCAVICSYGTAIWQTGAGLLLGGACWVMALSLFNVTVQLSTPRWVVGRALALYQTAVFGGMALGSWIWGIVAESQGVGIALLYAAATMLIGVVAGLRFPMPAQQALNLDPLNRWQQPDVALDLRPQSGPIFIVIEYIIRETDLPAFMEAMSERRRIRLRDGARQWELMRDLENPEIWRETYHAPTWVEYVRHNQRATHADAVIGETLRALHAGPELPKVQRMIVRPTDWTEALQQVKPSMDMH